MEVKMEKTLNARSNTEYQKHVEIIRLFGRELNGHQQATWHPEGVKNWNIWMPIIPRSVVNTKTVKDKWLNKYELGGLYIREYASDRTTVEYLKPDSPEATPSFMRLVFAKEKKNNSPYKFKGVYVYDPTKSKERNHVFRRISQSVLLKGEPVTEVVPILNN